MMRGCSVVKKTPQFHKYFWPRAGERFSCGRAREAARFRYFALLGKPAVAHGERLYHCYRVTESVGQSPWSNGGVVGGLFA